MARPRNFKASQGLTGSTFIFRSLNNVLSDGSGVVWDQTSPNDLYTGGEGFSLYTALFAQYKVLSVSVTYRALDTTKDSAGTGVKRGTGVTIVNPDLVESQPAGLNTIISRPSLKFINTNRTFTRTLYRPW